MDIFPGAHWVALVTVLALIEYSVLGVMVGRARGKYGIEAPATTGNPIFERQFRVHQNTLESLIVFLPAMWLFGILLSMRLAALLGLVFVVGRVIYVRGYVEDPTKRGPGAGVTFGVNAILILGSLIGVFVHW